MRLRNISPVLATASLTVLLDAAIVYHLGIDGIRSGVASLAVMVTSITMMVAPFFVLKMVAGALSGSRDETLPYVGEVYSITWRGYGRTRWAGRFKSGRVANFAAAYQAWYLDHFGDVYWEFGIGYRVYCGCSKTEGQ